MKKITLFLFFLIGFSLLNFAKIPQTNNHGFPFEKKCVARQTLEQQSSKNENNNDVIPTSEQKVKSTKTNNNKPSIDTQTKLKIDKKQDVCGPQEIAYNSVENKVISRSNKLEKPTKSSHVTLGGMLLLLLFYLLLIGMFVGGIIALCKGRIWLGVALIVIPIIRLTGIIISERMLSQLFYCLR